VEGPQVPRGWNATTIGSLVGRRYLVTGATSGLGLETARALSAHGAHVTITARRVEAARAMVADASARDFLELDLADLSSVRAAAARIDEPYDVVILNAGVMWTPYRLTVDGFELQMATNHLGHFAFAGLITPFIRERLVTVSSLYQRYGSFGDGSVEEIARRCRGESPYSPAAAYGDSKLANVLFTAEIERRRLQSGWSFVALAAHPGWSNTNLFSAQGAARGLAGRAARWSARFLAQSAARGALPQLCAATWSPVRGGEYFGPRGVGELRGLPQVTRPVERARDVALAANLWTVSQELTGVTWR